MAAHDPLTLYIGNRNYSSWSLRPWLALRHAGARFAVEVIALDRPDTAERIRAVSPSGRVPALRHGELLVWDSLAICEYVAELFPEAALWPADPGRRAVARAVAAEMHAGFAALRTAMPMNLRRAVAPIAITPEVRADLDRVIALWNECHRRYGGHGAFLFDHFTIADAMFAPVVTRLRSYGVEIEEEPAAGYAQAVWSMPHLQEWVAAACAEEAKIAKYEER